MTLDLHAAPDEARDRVVSFTTWTEAVAHLHLCPRAFRCGTWKR